MNKRKTLNTIFVAVLFTAMILGFGKTFLFPKDINEYENRYANKVSEFSISSYLRTDFQDSLEAAFADQIPLSEEAKENYNLFFSGIEKKTIDYLQSRITIDDPNETDTEPVKSDDPWDWLMTEKNTDKTISSYIQLSNGSYIYSNHILYGPNKLEWALPQYQARIDNINSLIDRHPEFEYYAYYVESDVGTDYTSNEKSGVADYVYENLNIPENHKGIYPVSCFDTLDKNFYKTDHHWNHLGSYRAYRFLGEILGYSDFLEPTEEITVGVFSGSKATGSDSSFSEIFKAYVFDFPECSYYSNGKQVDDYGFQTAWIKQIKNGEEISNISYGNFYGQDNGELIIENPSSDGGTILIFGESYDNALLKLLSNHYSKIISIDLRNYQAQTGKKFSFDSYVKGKGIDKVLFIGSCGYWYMEEFYL